VYHDCLQVFNEHPSRLLSVGVIQGLVAEATDCVGEDAAPGLQARTPLLTTDLSRQAYRYMLEQSQGRTMLEFQELMTVFQVRTALQEFGL
jgi:hypothetical protein